MSERVCKNHCGHDKRWVVEGVCRHMPVVIYPTDEAEECGHRCTFDGVGDAPADELVTMLKERKRLDPDAPDMIALPDAVPPQSEAQHEYKAGEDGKCAFVMGHTTKFFCGQPRSAPIHQVPAHEPEPLSTIDPYGEAVNRLWSLTKKRDGYSRSEMRAILESFAAALSVHQTPPAPAEVLTVESALAELREMLPTDGAVALIQRSTIAGHSGIEYHSATIRFGSSQIVQEVGSSPREALAEAMRAVREWKDKQNG